MGQVLGDKLVNPLQGIRMGGGEKKKGKLLKWG